HVWLSTGAAFDYQSDTGWWGKLLSLNYGYDSVGNITQIGNDYYNYDGMNRLTWAGDSSTSRTGNGVAWTYDITGNMMGKESYLGGASQGNVAFGYDLANRLWSMGSKSYMNDNAGNRVGKTDTSAWGYIYDGENRLKQVTRNGIDILDNSYDGSGVRVKEVKGGQTTYFVYQGNNPLLEYIPSDGSYKYFIYAGNKLVAEETNGVVKYYHGDHLGSTRLVTDASGVVVASYKFKPYGEREAYSGSFSTDYQFTGKPGIDEVGLSYFGARFYDPETGRFLSVDPGRQGLNWYAYCANNPLKYVDPNGRAYELTKTWAATGWVAAAADGPLPVGDAVYVGGIVVLAVGETCATYGPQIMQFLDANEYYKAALKNMTICFTEDTPVYTKDGYRFIKDIKVGDEVYSENPETGEKGLKNVTQVFVNETQTLVHIFVGNTELKATHSHPFWVVGKGWVDAGKLIIGDNLLLYSGEVAKVTAVKIEQLLEPIKVYNFEVEDWHTYFVSRCYILVHNACGISADFEKRICKMSPNERVATVRQTAMGVAQTNGWVKDSKLSKINGRDVYRDPQTGTLYAVDSQHGRLEVCTADGEHLGEMNMDGQQTKPADTSGGHDLYVP
ncbi:MAG TPA: polymorphic toxin-type HINT domain-containing protein, partial [Bacillota bacterium]|nr:polymorphic toxin-type HINT domain-containing protein [Bacillota bacterium]